ACYTTNGSNQLLIEANSHSISSKEHDLLTDSHNSSCNDCIPFVDVNRIYSFATWGAKISKHSLFHYPLTRCKQDISLIIIEVLDTKHSRNLFFRTDPFEQINQRFSFGSAATFWNFPSFEPVATAKRCKD